MADDNGLKHDGKRDASASIAGYVYQIYQSIFAWVHLGDYELLFLEGAEDFDVLADNNAETTQVKNKSKNITLRSEEVADALENFWDHCSNNPDHQIRFRFLSTANQGIEKQSPIPNSMTGIDYWQRVARNPSLDTQPLRTLLLCTIKSNDLKGFIENSSDDELREKLILRINWDLGNKPFGSLESALCHWANGNKEKTLEEFSKIIEKLEKITVNDDLFIHNLFATIGLSLIWIYFEVSNFKGNIKEDSLTKPRTGMFSNPQPHENIKKYGIRDTNSLWEILSLIEQNLEINLGISKKYDAFNIPPSPHFDSRQRQYKLSQCWVKGDFDFLITKTVAAIESYEYVKSAKVGKNNLSTRKFTPVLPSEFWKKQDNLGQILCRILGASLVLTMQEPAGKLPLSQWRRDANQSAILEIELNEFLDVLNGEQPKNEAYQYAAASINNLRTGKKTPHDMWRAYFRILNIFAHWHGEEGASKLDDALNYLCVNDWLYAVKNQGFLFSNPRDICPKIEALCNKQNLNGIVRIAKILEISAIPLKLNLAPDCKGLFEKAKNVSL